MMKKPALPPWIKDAETWISLALITLVSALTHLPFIDQMGYYKNDWYPIWAGRTQTLSTMVSMFSIDRPILGYIYTRAYLLLGDSPLNWQLFAWLFRLAGAIGFFLLLRQIWPKMRLFTASAAILFVVYPGFLEGPAAVTFSNHLIAYALAIYSILFTVVSLRARNRYAAAGAAGLALLCQLGYPIIYEYMIGLEGLRLLLIWHLLPRPQRSMRAKWTAAFLRWLPYLLIAAGFLFWRFFIFKSTRPTTDVSLLLGRYSAAPLETIQKMAAGTLMDIFDAILLGWVVPFYQLVSAAQFRDLALGAGLALLVGALFWAYFRWMKKNEPLAAEDKGFPRDSLGIGLAAVFCAILPVALSNRHILFSNWLDRYTLHTTVGVTLLIAALIFLLTKERGRLWLVLGLLFLSVTTHFTNLAYFRNIWETQRQLWWQLAWRAPRLADGTVLLVNLPAGIPSFEEGYEAWMPANIIYNDAPNTVRIFAQVLYPTSALQVLAGATEHQFLRNTDLDLDYKQALIVSQPAATSCLHVLDGGRPELSLAEPPLVSWIAPYSRIQQIVTDNGAPPPPAIIFGEEPPHTWCYYYQKMSLARQRGDWGQVAALGEEARAAGCAPLDLSEWMPLVEGYAYSGELEKAESFIKAINMDSNLRYNLCISVLAQAGNPALDLPVEGMGYLLERLCGISE
jgi:hypothetical protein